MRNLSITLLLIILCMVSCEKGASDALSLQLKEGNGVFLINEGNFNRGNGSLSYYNLEEGTVINNIYSGVNGLILGDTPNSIIRLGDSIFIAVNNSGKIVTVDATTGRRIGSISGIKSPREMVSDNMGNLYVSTLRSDSIVVVNQATLSVTGYINAGMTTEALLYNNGKLYASNWSEGHSLLVINTETGEVDKIIEVGLEPESMVLDIDDNLWVLCSGGYLNQENPSLRRINLTAAEVDRIIYFPDNECYPTSLNVSTGKDSLLLLCGGVKKMSVGDETLPSGYLIEQSNSRFYRMAVSPESGEIFITDAADYQQKGNLLRYGRNGIVIDKDKVGIIPGRICFY